MNKTKKFILIRSEPEALTMYKETALKINNPFSSSDKSLLNESEYNLNRSPNTKNSFKIRIDKKSPTGVLMNQIATRTQNSLASNQAYNNKENTKINLINNENNNSQQGNLNLTNKSDNNKNFYLTSSLNSLYKNPKFKNESNSTKETNYMIDLIHKKEITLCLDLIKNLEENGINNAKTIEDDKEKNSEETNNLIGLIKKFNFDNINNQKRIEHQIINDDSNNSLANNNNIIKSDLNTVNDLSLLMTTNFKTNNLVNNKDLNQNINISPLDKNLNNSSMELKNNNSSIIQNNSNIINEKSKLMKSASTNNINISKIKDSKFGLNMPSNRMDFFKNEINFHTGFIRSQKNLYNGEFKFSRKKIKLNPKSFRKKKKEAEKLTLPEIEEYKSIIKEFQKRKRKKQKQSQSIVELKKELGELDLKDQLIEELQDIYQEQKNTFLWDLHETYGDGVEIKEKIDPLKEEINNNIRNINQVKRTQNYFVDGYSLFTGKINKRLNEFNHILGNKFYDKDQKKEKEEKFHKCIEQFENKLKRYKNELLNEENIYRKIFKQKIDFRKDKYQENYEDEKFNIDKKYIIK